MNYFYNVVYGIIATIVFIIFPIAFYLLFLLFPDEANLQHYYYLKKALTTIMLMMAAFVASMVLIKFKYERAPRKANEWSLVIITTTVILICIINGVLISKNYMLIVLDESPQQHDTVLTSVDEYFDPYFSILDNSKITSFPLDYPGFSSPRNCITVSIAGRENPLPLACYLTNFEETSNHLYDTLTMYEGESVKITILPTSKRVIKLEVGDEVPFSNEAFKGYLQGY